MAIFNSGAVRMCGVSGADWVVKMYEVVREGMGGQTVVMRMAIKGEGRRRDDKRVDAIQYDDAPPCHSVQSGFELKPSIS